MLLPYHYSDQDLHFHWYLPMGKGIIDQGEEETSVRGKILTLLASYGPGDIREEGGGICVGKLKREQSKKYSVGASRSV